jgi:hypothetical protein
LTPVGEQAGYQEVIGKRVRLPGHFAGVARLEGAERLDGAYHLRVRTEAGTLDETLVRDEDIAADLIELVDERAALVDANDFFDLIEAHRIELAFAHDPNFAVPAARDASSWLLPSRRAFR